jgi:hypothetical protein
MRSVYDIGVNMANSTFPIRAASQLQAGFKEALDASNSIPKLGYYLLNANQSLLSGSGLE